MQKFFLYARKSTDVEDKQVRSIEDQITELRAFAKQENLEIIEELIEKQSAKIPGRPIFNEMLEQIERSEANGILAWHPDRLARNSVDGGKIIYLLDCGHLEMLKFPTFWAENTSQGKFMLNIAFGQSKYYVDNLSENTKRGLRQKVRRGEYPGFAPIGYINDSRTKTVVVDRKKSVLIRKAFELYAENNSRLEDVSNFLAQCGIVSLGGKNVKRDRISYLLSNPFYIGLFRYAGEVYEGKHQPVISKKIFDRVQEILKQRGRPHHKPKNEAQAYCGLLKCGICGMMITGEYKIKRQKNGNEHHYVYYHCTRKNKLVKCKNPAIREEDLNKQISSLLQKFSLRKDWADQLSEMLEKDKKGNAQSSFAFVKENQDRIVLIKSKLQKLLDGYLEQDIEREVYRTEKVKLLSEKKTLEERIFSLSQKRTGWIEPMEKWIKEAENLDKIARESNFLEKKVAAKEIFGSNLTLSAKKVFEPNPKNPKQKPQAHWAAINAAHKKSAENGNCLKFAERQRIELMSRGYSFQSNSDTEIILGHLALSDKSDLVSALIGSLSQVRGAYSLLAMNDNKIIATRDPHGFRPLSLATFDYGYLVSSETCAFDFIEKKYGVRYLRDVEPGEVVVLSKNGLESIRSFPKTTFRPCVFELIYFSRPDSKIFGRYGFEFRMGLGKIHAEEHSLNPTCVVGIPDSANYFADGLAERLMVPHRRALVRSHYTGRTFISPDNVMRSNNVRLKLNPIRPLIEGHCIMLADDSIVRGTTSKKIVSMIRSCNPKSIAFSVSCPPIIGYCPYGIDIKVNEELIAHQKSTPEICQFIGADALHYLSLEALKLVAGDDFCYGCFTGEYPIT